MIAHELAHIKNRDMLLQTFTATLAGAVSSLGPPGATGARRLTQPVRGTAIRVAARA